MKKGFERAHRNILVAFLNSLKPITAGGKVARYLKSRGIYKKTWNKARLREISNYHELSERLQAEFSETQLIESGLFNEKGNLRYFKHPLIFPFIDLEGKALTFQARAIDKETTPKELNLRGGIPIPFNLGAVKAPNPIVYLCEGAIDTLSLLEKGFHAVGIPGVGSFKREWVSYFKGKKIIIAFDADEAGDKGADFVLKMLRADGLDASRLQMPPGTDINAWFS